MTSKQFPEKGVALGDALESSAVRALGLSTVPASTVSEGVPVFKTDDGTYKNFKVEYGVKDKDIVIHFYLPLGDLTLLGKADPKTQKSWNAFWLEVFPAALSPAAQEFFRAGTPRILAKYTQEVASWWFVARGFGSQVLDPKTFAEQFLEKLDAVQQLHDARPPPLGGT
mgnify:CR=1 FL=1